MKHKIAVVVLLIVVVLTTQSAASNSEKSREKRSPNPQFGKLFAGLISRWVPKIAKEVSTVVKLVRKNPGTATAGAAVGIGSLVASQKGKKPCVVNIKRDLPELQPVFITTATPHSLMVPTDGYLTWAHGQSSPIACPPSALSRNSISGTNTVVNTITCESGLDFYLNGALVSISTIKCDQKVTGNFLLKPADPQCAGSVKAIGFNVPFPLGNQFIDLFYSCFDDTRGSALFTHHVLFGNEIEHKCVYGSNRPDFKSSGFTSGYFVSTAYTKASQMARLTDLFAIQLGNAVAYTEANIFFNQSFLQRGHLTPDADELFTTWQWSTYFYINVAPMWDSINMGNWKTLEMKVRSLAAYSRENLEIFTGSFDSLELCTTTNYCTQFTLVNGGVPVPKWLWKIVKAPSKDAAIALVVSNNPFVSAQPICGSSQNNYGWHQDSFDEVQLGRVSYCKVQDLQNVIGYLPQAAMATNILLF